MLRLAFDFIITWRETRTRPNAYIFFDAKNRNDITRFFSRRSTVYIYIPYPIIKETIKSLKNRTFPYTICSNKTRETFSIRQWYIINIFVSFEVT